MTFERKRGDDYPLIAWYKVDGVLIDVETATDLKFSYEDEDGNVSTINGTAVGGELGKAQFIPLSGTDFETVGVYTYDLQRIDGGYTYTHDDGTLHITQDVTP